MEPGLNKLLFKSRDPGLQIAIRLRQFSRAPPPCVPIVTELGVFSPLVEHVRLLGLQLPPQAFFVLSLHGGIQATRDCGASPHDEWIL